MPKGHVTDTSAEPMYLLPRGLDWEHTEGDTQSGLEVDRSATAP